MPYSVEHVRFTLECDACGLTEKRDLDDVGQRKDFERDGIAGWTEIRTSWQSYFCCPACAASVGSILSKREREVQAAKDLVESNCEHDYHPSGLLARCWKCKKFR